jgi:hypothetical protein
MQTAADVLSVYSLIVIATMIYRGLRSPPRGPDHVPIPRR